MRSADGARLYLADEDHKALRILTLPLGEAPKSSAASEPAPTAARSASASSSAAVKPPPAKKPFDPMAPPPPIQMPASPPAAKQVEVALPGAPANVLPLDGRVLVTIRDLGLLIVLSERADGTLTEESRIEIAKDAWGIAVDKQEKIAIVSSAWTHTLTGIDLSTLKVLWTVSVAREPRGVVIHPDGKRAYVSHLTSGDLTRIDGIDTKDAKASVVKFPAAPNRAPQGFALDASLGYALVLDDDGNRLLAARQALGGLGERVWGGLPTVDVLQTADDTPLLSPRAPNKPIRSTPMFDELKEQIFSNAEEKYRQHLVTGPTQESTRFVQPRAMVVAHASKTVWLASEGADTVVELRTHSAAPLERPVREVGVGAQFQDPKLIDAIPAHCGAPTGLALSEDEQTLYVFCRSTYDVATVSLKKDAKVAIAIVRVAEDPLGEAGSRGRRLFYEARDGYSSGGMGCAGCHPDGRDDGHVWHEVVVNGGEGSRMFLAHQNLGEKTKVGKLGYARQTPMLAGRVDSSGPFGWHAQDANITERLADGFALHRWTGDGQSNKVDVKHWLTGERANALSLFLRKGLVSPPPLGRPLSAIEQQGKKVFESDGAQCSTCHVPTSDLTNRATYDVGMGTAPPGFEDDVEARFKTPSLLFVSGTAPYFHDGSAATLTLLINDNRDRMGKTSQLSQAERDALIAYLETL